jgi:hypothetical protein
MCSSDINPYWKPTEDQKYCPECDIPVDDEGVAEIGCSYGREECETCGYRGCDESC